MPNIVLALTGASGAHAADLLVQKSPWPVTLVASRWGRDVYERECGPFERIAGAVDRVLDDDDLSASVASGSVPTEGMVVLPCSSNTMAQIAAGLGSTLVARAAHCHLKEGRKLVLCVREAPWTVMDLDNARAVATAGGIVMPLSPPSTSQPAPIRRR
jgi:4-hydroxy-3-polyprenylbenzoate decarboxylase